MARKAKHAYLLLHLAIMSDSCGPGDEVIAAMTRSASELGISIWPWEIYDNEPGICANPINRIFFTVPSGYRDDEYAEKIAESILLSLELFEGSTIDLVDDHVALPFRNAKYSKISGIHYKTLLREIEDANEEVGFSFQHTINGWSAVVEPYIALVFKALPTVVNNNKLRLAMAFLAHAQHDFYVCPGGLNEAVHDGDWIPTRMSILARWESAYQNCFKAVEAIIGDPPKKEIKLRNKLLCKGMNPDEEVGYKKKEKITDVIREMSRIRDTLAAHGSTPNRGIKYSQMTEFQACAKYLLERWLDKEYGGNFFEQTSENEN